MKWRFILNLMIGLTVFSFNYRSVFAELKQDSPATPSPIAQRQPNCNNPQNNIEIKECIRLRYEAADRRLNEVYKQLIGKLSREERSLISEAQQGWIQLRENNCHFEVYGSRMGTGYRGFLNECRERMTQQRTAELEKYVRER